MTHAEHDWRPILIVGDVKLEACTRCALYRYFVAGTDARPVFLVPLAMREYVCTGAD